jgi:hypothetical protein
MLWIFQYEQKNPLNPVAIGYGFSDRGYFLDRGKNIYLHECFQTVSEAHPSNGYRGFHSHRHTGRDVKLITYFNLVPIIRIYGAVPPVLIRIMNWCLIKHRD